MGSEMCIRDRCNQCQVLPQEEIAEKGISEGELAEGKTEEVDLTEEEVSEEVEKAEETGETEETEEAEGGEQTTEGTEEEKTPPAIELQIYEGPIYSSSDNVCYYRIKALVTGNPSPDVEFSRDDSGGAWGEYKVQVNLNSPNDSYTLVATATNSEGSDSDSITLDWGCPVEENNDPEVVFSQSIGKHYYTSRKYNFSAVASDIDGDVLTYSWSVSGGSIDDNSVNPISWTTPSIEGDYDVTVTVDDGRGGTATKTKSVKIYKLYELSVPIIESEGGFVELDVRTYPGGFIYAGDSDNNKPCKGFMSFDITAVSYTHLTLPTN